MLADALKQEPHLEFLGILPKEACSLVPATYVAPRVNVSCRVVKVCLESPNLSGEELRYPVDL